jgi:protein N-lysine methyltransferase METTL21D
MSDVTYNTSSFPALIKTLKGLVDISPRAWVILGYKERHTTERTAWNMFEDEVKLRLKKVKEVKGAGGAPVEIWIGQSFLYTNSQ